MEAEKLRPEGASGTLKLPSKSKDLGIRISDGVNSSPSPKAEEKTYALA